jgi:outer membrane cobalamin receptor
VYEIYEDLPTTDSPDVEVTSANSHFTMNGRISKEIGEHFAAYIECENLFDKDYASEIGFPSPGRNAIIGIKASF